MPEANVAFFPNSWSQDGQRLAGTRSGYGILVFSLATRTYEKLAPQGEYPVWMRDSRRLLYLSQGKVRVLDSGTKEAREVLVPPAGSSFKGLDLSPDERTLYLGRATPEGDVCLLTTTYESRR